MNHTVRKINHDTARVAFELCDTVTPTSALEIWRVHHNDGLPFSRPEGIIMGDDPLKPRAVVVNAHPGDMIVVREKIHSDDITPYSCYYISKSFEPRLVEDASSLLCEVTIAPPISRFDAGAGRVIFADHEELATIFRGRHPRWFQRIIDHQLEYWRDHAPAIFVRHAPREWLESNIGLLTQHDPQRALRDYRDGLTTEQFAYCTRMAPAEAVRFALKRIPRKLRKQALLAGGAYALENHLHQLTDDELRNCSLAFPVSAIMVRHLVEPREHAIILSCSYTVAWCKVPNPSGKRFHKEVLNSLVHYPDEWLRSNPKGFETIFNKLSNRACIRFKPKELVRLLRHLPPSGRNAVVNLIVNNI